MPSFERGISFINTILQMEAFIDSKISSVFFFSGVLKDPHRFNNS